jgi:hypothetical protein
VRRLALAALLLGSSGCAAHLPRSDEALPFMERSTFALSTARGQTAEVSPAFHVLVGDGLGEERLEHGGAALVSSISLLSTLRLWHEDSAPVRTPTYEPRAKLQLFRVAPAGSGRAVARLVALELGAGHRSNGQRGCSLAGHVRRPGDTDFGCAPATNPPVQALNLEDGSFTTNYAFAGANVRWLLPGPPGEPVAAAFTLGSGAEWHVPCGLGSCMQPQMRARHGAVVGRWRVEGELLLLRGVSRALLAGRSVRLDSSLRVTLSGEVHLGAAGGPFGGTDAEIALVPRDRRGWPLGLFVRRHVGRDPLNIRFEERLDAWLFGVTLDPGPLEKLGGRGASPHAPPPPGPPPR